MITKRISGQQKQPGSFILQAEPLSRSYHVAESICRIYNSNCSMFCCTLLYVHSGVAVVLVGGGGWLLSFNCLPGVTWWLGGSSSRCHGVVCSK